MTIETLREWERLKLLRPAGNTDDQIPFYTLKSLKEAEHVLKLLELGYELEEVCRIVRKVRLPTAGYNGERQEGTHDYLTVGALAEKVGVSPRTIKHWEDKGIIVTDMRSDGGFRLYPDVYVYLCNLIKDLQLFGYSLEEIKTTSNYFREFLELQNNLERYSREEAAGKLDHMLTAIDDFFNKMEEFKTGIQRWEELLKKKKKEVHSLRARNRKRVENQLTEAMENA